MRNGYILLHRKGITREEWKHPRRTLAWIDLLTLADYETGIVVASYGYLAERWRVSKHTAFDWMQHFIGERQLERQEERDRERNGERWFVVNYAKYQNTEERDGERGRERKGERRREPKKEISSSKLRESSQEYGGTIVPTPAQLSERFFTDTDQQEAAISYMVEKGFGEPLARHEMAKFLAYWTEPSRSGKKLRWEDEKHFDVKRRLATWFERVRTDPRARQEPLLNANI